MLLKFDEETVRKIVLQYCSTNYIDPLDLVPGKRINNLEHLSPIAREQFKWFIAIYFTLSQPDTVIKDDSVDTISESNYKKLNP